MVIKEVRMKIIQAMKKVKELLVKAEDLRKKVGNNCAHLDMDKPEYDNPKQTISGWIQAYEDILKEVLGLRIAIQRTNLQTMVEIELGGKTVKKTIAEWIHRRRDLAKQQMSIWQSLTDRGLQSGFRKASTGEGDSVRVEVVRNFEPTVRDEKVELYRSEPMTIDSTLEVVNAVTDLVE